MSNTSSSTSENVTEINGYFSSTKQYIIENDSMKVKNGYNYAILYDSLHPINFNVLQYGINVGNMTINTINLKREISGSPPYAFDYNDSLNSVINKPCTWSISGLGNFQSLTFYDFSVYPYYSGFKDLPDTLLAHTSNTISIGNYGGAEKVGILLRNINYEIYKEITPPQKNLVLTADDMGQLGAGGGQVEIRLDIYKNDFRTFGNKIFQINNALYIWKNTYLKE